MVDDARETTAKKSCMYGDYGSFEHLLFLFNDARETTAKKSCMYGDYGSFECLLFLFPSDWSKARSVDEQ